MQIQQTRYGCTEYREDSFVKIYLAPMEGLTGYTFRQVYDECFGGVDKYFTPFLSPGKKKKQRNTRSFPERSS